MLARIYYALKNSIKYKYQISLVLEQKAVDSVDYITKSFLVKQKIKCLILDFDGVLASHGELEMPLEKFEWLQKLIGNFPEVKIYILSNKPNKQREHYFRQHFPSINFVSGVRKKPYPEGILKIIQLSKTNPENCIMVDDRLLTGILAAILASVQPCLIKKPVRNFQKRFIKESFFAFLRWFERLVFRLFVR